MLKRNCAKWATDPRESPGMRGEGATRRHVEDTWKKRGRDVRAMGAHMPRMLPREQRAQMVMCQLLMVCPF